MKKLLMILACGAILIGVNAAQETKSKYDADEKTAKDIRAALKDFEVAWNRQDIDKVSSFYAADAEVFV